MANHSETLVENTQKYLIQSGNISGISDHLPQFAIFETNKTNEKTVKQLRNWLIPSLKILKRLNGKKY